MAETKSQRFTEHLIASAEREKPRRSTQTTRDHEVIRKWAEDRGAQPASTVRSENTGLGVLRLDFPGQRGRPLKRIDWGDWFRAFDERDLCFVYEDKSDNGMRSDFFRLELSG
ncbi:MAG TPA: hypothetical protein VMD07_07030 [Candidatus Acidoferrales bacterium]|nr:hypothetical protein [Candidatus Acidoferrales bacterium]